MPKAAGRASLFVRGASPEATATVGVWTTAGIKVAQSQVHEASGGVTQGAGEGDSAVLYTEMLTAMTSELTAKQAVAA